MQRRTSSHPSTASDVRPSQRHPSDNVISMRLDAAFFYERGVKFLERNQLRKAEQAFRKTIEYEPDNPVNHCNLAGVLSELGDFEGSNEVLLHVLEKIDPNMAECQFYLANNYANMGQFDIAEEYVLRYLDADPDGEFAPDAEEMLDILLDEFGGGEAFARWESERAERERAQAAQDGRQLLEDGQFEAAVEWLTELTQRNPSDLAAHNNLSLAYYYTGRYQRAIETALHVLTVEPDNLHALCNLAVFTAHVGPLSRLKPIVAQLTKLFPLHYDHAMKVGTTLGIIGEHEAAFSIFYKLARFVDQPEPVLIHSIAAAAANIGRYATAIRWWKLLAQYPEMEEVATYYIDAVREAIRNRVPHLRISYQYDVPLQVKFREIRQRMDHGDVTGWRHDPLFRASLYWGLRHGSAEMQRSVIRTLAVLGDADAERGLRGFLEHPDVPETLQAAALYALQRMGAQGTVAVWRHGELREVAMRDVPSDIILSVDEVWFQIHAEAQAWLCNNGHTALTDEAKRVWIGFAKHLFQRSQRPIGKPEIWVAGLLYTVLKHHKVPVRQRDLAEAFHVSTSSISKAAGRLGRFFVTMP
ncbi:MAG: tetratricopeptide repeat protein [Alicyclobacillus sp.]|nr:tetratricopeptide repeat protein [Alicyclobacillus sp.]